jgi:hypothetical protein
MPSPSDRIRISAGVGEGVGVAVAFDTFVEVGSKNEGSVAVGVGNVTPRVVSSLFPIVDDLHTESKVDSTITKVSVFLNAFLQQSITGSYT